MPRHHRIQDDYDVPPWAHEIYENQRLLQTRMDEIMATISEVRADVQAFIANVEQKLDDAASQATNQADLQAQLDGIASDLQAARDRMNGSSGGGSQPSPSPLPDPTPAPEPTPAPDQGLVSPADPSPEGEPLPEVNPQF